MTLLHGSTSLRMFHMSRPPDIEQMQQLICPGRGPGNKGFTAYNSVDVRMLDIKAPGLPKEVDIFRYVIWERRVNNELLKTECEMEERAVRAAEGREFLNRKQKAEIRQQVKERLETETPLTPRSCEFLIDRPHNLLLIASTSINWQDRIMCALAQCGMRWIGIQLMFLPERAPEILPGRDTDLTLNFLTWLYFKTNTSRNVERLIIQAPFVFVDSSMDQRVDIRADSGPEVVASLQSNRLLSACHVYMPDCNKNLMHFKLNSALSVSSVSTPKSEYMEQASRTQERYEQLVKIPQAIIAAWKKFIEAISAANELEITRRGMLKWIKEL